ncbi:MAG: mandelate racemase/muconate lactonizing enzyme family protein [Bryobacteraceae bacterium]
MKITSVELFVLKSEGLYNNPEGAEEPLGPPYMGIVKVSTDSGICGYSDLETCASVAKACVDAPRWSQEQGMEFFDGLATLLIGENPLEVERLWYRMYRGTVYYGRRGVVMQAISAIDIALWDICGKFYGQPVHILLGGKWRDKVRAYASTLFRPTPEAMSEAAMGYLDQGFTAVKFGWGVFGKDRRHDVKLVEAARKALGDRNDLLIDTGWFVERTAKEAIQVVRSIEQFAPFLIEEPLHPEDYDGYRQLSAAVDVRIACGSRKQQNGALRG